MVRNTQTVNDLSAVQESNARRGVYLTGISVVVVHAHTSSTLLEISVAVSYSGSELLVWRQLCHVSRGMKSYVE